MRRPATISKSAPPEASASNGSINHQLSTINCRVWLSCLLLMLVTIILYWPVTGYDFISVDDPENFSANPVVQSGLSWKNAAWAFTTISDSSGNSSWYPLTWLSFMLDVSLFGKGPHGPHFTNLLLHAANSALIFWFLWRTTRACWRSALVAALFALHPLRVEAVAWITERKDVLSACFGLLSLIFYAGYARRKEMLHSRGAILDYTMALLCFALSLMSKAMFVTLPFVLLLLDYWPLRRGESGEVESASPPPLISNCSLFSRLVFEKIPFFVLTGMSCLITTMVYKKMGQLVPLAARPLSARIENVFTNYTQYLGKTFWPANLTLLQPYHQQWSAMQTGLAMALMACLCLAALWLGRSRPFVFVGWFFFLGTLVPVIGLVQWNQLGIPDQFTYLPLVGLFILLAWGGCDVLARWPRLKTAVMTSLAVILVACALRTRDQLRYWKDSETLFRHMLTITGNNSVIHFGLGAALLNKGETDEAITQFQETLRLAPNYLIARINLGTALLNKGWIDEAIEQYREAIRIDPKYAPAHYNLGVALLDDGQTDEAISEYQETLRLNPNLAEAHLNLGIALDDRGRMNEAVNQYQEAIRLDANLAVAHLNLGIDLYNQGHVDEAINEYQETIRLGPNLAEAHFNLGLGLASKGRMDDAIQQFQEAIRLKPDYVEAREDLALALKIKSAPAGKAERGNGQ